MSSWIFDYYDPIADASKPGVLLILVYLPMSQGGELLSDRCWQFRPGDETALTDFMTKIRADRLQFRALVLLERRPDQPLRQWIATGVMIDNESFLDWLDLS